MGVIEVTIDSELLPWQERILSEARRFNVLAKGRRTGGTSLVEDLMVDLAAHGNPIGWFSQSDKLMYETWVRFVDSLSGITRRKSEQKRRIDLHGGGHIECWSCESRVTTRSRKYYAVGIDEAAHIPGLMETWEREIRPSLMDLEGGAWFPSSPNGMNDYKTLWDRGQDPEFPEWKSWQVPTHENPTIPPSELVQMEHELSDISYAQEVLALFVSMEGACFSNFTRAQNVIPVPYDPALRVKVGVDFGIQTSALVYAQLQTNDKLRVFADNELHDKSTEQLADELAGEPFAQNIDLIACDPQGNARDIQTGIEDVQILRKALPWARVTFSTNTKHRNPEYRVGKIRDLVRSKAGDVRLFIDPRCKHTIRTMEQSVYPKARVGSGEKNEPVKDGVVDHNRDALGYLVVNLLHRGETVMGGERPC